MGSFALRGLFVLAGLGLGAAAFAQVAFSNLGPASFPYEPEHGYSLPTGVRMGFQFRAQASGTVSGISLGINNLVEGAPIFFTTSIYTDVAGKLGTTTGYYEGLTTGVTKADKRLSELDVAGGAATTLTQGSDYWLIVNLTPGAFWSNAVGDPHGRGFRVGGMFEYDDYTALPAAEVRVGAVPEPASLATLTLGLVFLRRRSLAKRRRGASANRA